MSNCKTPFANVPTTAPITAHISTPLMPACLTVRPAQQHQDAGADAEHLRQASADNATQHPARESTHMSAGHARRG